jgi:CelD/BcsL family acetyltransferase involved in cellulose biosynthesis
MLTHRFVPWGEVGPAERAQWQRLMETTHGAPDLSIDWAASLIEAHRISAADVRVLILSDATQARALVPLRLTTQKKGAFKLLTVEPLINAFSLHENLLSEVDLASCVSALMAAVTSEYGQWAELIFSAMVRDSALSQAIRTCAAAKGLPVASTWGDHSPFLSIRGGWDDFLQGKSANFRSNLKRKSRRLLDMDGVEIRFITEPDQMGRALSAVHTIENKSWKAAEGTAITSRPWEEAFYAAIATKFSPSGQVLITLVTLNGEPLAFDLTLLGGGCAYCLKTSFDAERAELSAGVVLRTELMRRVFALGIEEYDFLGKNERYKLEWSETTRQAETVRIVNTRSWAGWSLRSVRRLRSVVDGVAARFGSRRSAPPQTGD